MEMVTGPTEWSSCCNVKGCACGAMVENFNLPVRRLVESIATRFHCDDSVAVGIAAGGWMRVCLSLRVESLAFGCGCG